ncbi:MAG TPA: hypothetical protein VIG34_02370 [Xanthobacteraceae bacterium]|jgi:hypothetical protein
MICTLALALGLASSFVARAEAQSFDGTYRGTRTITRAVLGGEQVSMPDCPGVGGKTTAIEFQVRQSRCIICIEATSSSPACSGPTALSPFRPSGLRPAAARRP